ncbi:MAG: ECF transporter S component [Ruminococcaceae bacterium]|nr:ECF transporter S component [Oscillospiraceae bacterium]
MNQKTKQLTTIAMLSALAYIVMWVGRIPVVLFLKYDPKDVIITIGGFLHGPLSAFVISALVSLVEMFSASDTGVIGLLMNILSTCAFSCTAAVIYKKKRTLSGAAIGLTAGVILMVVMMLLWNYFITPLYMKTPRDVVAGMLLPVFLPFNLIKGILNAALTMLLYKPVSKALRRSGLMPASASTAGSSRSRIGVTLVSLVLLATGILLVLVMQGKI